jgi:hypothetical protein
MAEYLGKLRGAGRVTIADVGSASSTVVSWHNGQLEPRIYTNMGLGHNAQSLLQTIGLNAVRRWLPFNASTSEIINYAMNKTLRPGTIPGTLKDGYFEHALLRAIIQTIAQEIGILAEKSDSKIPGLIIGAGAGLTYTGHPGYTSMLLLDALQPTGVTELHADPFGLIATMGAIAQVAPEAVVQLIDSQSLDHLGTSFSLSGKPRLDKTAMRVKIITGHGDKIEQKVDGGHLWIFPLPVGERARVEVRVSRGLNIGGRGRVKLTVEGGSAGLIFDARGRPLPLAATAGRRAAQLPLWVSEATGDPLMEIDPRWLEDIEEDDLEMPLRTRPDREAAADTGDADDLFDLMDDDDDDQDDDQDDTMGISELRDALS